MPVAARRGPKDMTPEAQARARAEARAAAKARADDRRAAEPAGNRVSSHKYQNMLRVAPAKDHFEAEAEALASAVTTTLQRSSTGAQASAESEGGEHQAADQAHQKVSAGRAGKATSGAISAEHDAPTDVIAGIAKTKRGGDALSPALLGELEEAFGKDFSHVRVHTDKKADALTRSVKAEAFTSGNHIYFRSGAFDADSADGQHALAHELVHTMQQSGGNLKRTIQRFGG